MSVAVRTSLAVEAEREQRQLAQCIGTITAAFNHARTPEAVGRTLLRGVELLTGIRHAFVVLFNASKRDEATVMLSGPLQEDERELMLSMKPLDHPVEVEIFRTGQSVTGERLRRLLDPSLDIPREIDGLAAIPVRDGPRVDGALYLLTPHAPGAPGFHELSPDDLATLEALCEQTAVALERTRLKQLAQRTAQEQRVLSRIAGRVSAASHPASITGAALDKMGNLVPTRSARLTRCSGDHERRPSPAPARRPPGTSRRSSRSWQ